MKNLTLVLAGVLMVMMSCAEKRLDYPAARKADVVEDYHGTKVADPYRWLEDADAPETVAWVEAENRITRQYIHESKNYAEINQRIRELYNYPRYSTPYKKGRFYFFSKNDGLQNQSVVYRQASLTEEPHVVIDPNTFSEDGTVALSTFRVSEDGSLAAYGISRSGSDWQDIKVRDLQSGEDFPETLKWAKFSSIAWKHDGSGFYYNRFPDPSTVSAADRNNYNRVYFHKLGTDQQDDPLVYKDDENKELGFSPFITDDGRYLVLHVWHGTDTRNRIYYRPVKSAKPFVKLLDEADASYSMIHNDGPVFYFKTDLEAPRGRILAVDIRRPQRDNWRQIIPESDDVLDFVTVVNNHFVAAYMHDAHHLLKIFDLNGQPQKDLQLPAIGSVNGLSGRYDEPEMFITFTSFLYPTTIFRYDFNDDSLSVFHKSEIDFSPDGYTTKQVFYTSKDGTRVPMFLTHKKGIALDGSNPTILYGYGGFNISLTPYFSATRLLWLEKGGVFALANLRGGDEYGEQWHQAGMLDKKQNVFDDFIAAAEWLIAKGYTSTEKLAINGGSNGGLLVAACMNQRPDLFGAVVCQVPVIDMLRYHKFTVGRYWVPEYGNAEENADHFKFLYAYSPLHTVRADVDYPPALITTADTDDRVAPLHAKKYAATLQEKYKGRNPILLRVETKAGHGGGKPTSKQIEEMSDIYAFLFKVFGMDM